MTSTTCDDEVLQVTCIVYHGLSIELFAPPYLNESDRIVFTVISDPTSNRTTVDGVSFRAELLEVQIIPPDFGNFKVLLTVDPALNPLSVSCGNGLDVVKETILLRGKLVCVHWLTTTEYNKLQQN